MEEFALLGELELQLADREVRMTYTEAARNWIAKHGYDKKMSAPGSARSPAAAARVAHAED